MARGSALARRGGSSPRRPRPPPPGYWWSPDRFRSACSCFLPAPSLASQLPVSGHGFLAVDLAHDVHEIAPLRQRAIHAEQSCPRLRTLGIRFPAGELAVDRLIERLDPGLGLGPNREPSRRFAPLSADEPEIEHLFADLHDLLQELGIGAGGLVAAGDILVRVS